MDTRDMWENQVELLTQHCQSLTQEVDELRTRLQYFEDVVVTLVMALKQGGCLSMSLTMSYDVVPCCERRR